MTDAKRSGQRGIGQFELAERIIREQLRDPEVASGPRCIYFRKPDDSANPTGPRGLYQVIFSSTGCMDDAAELRRNGHGLDGTHKAVEDDICTDALLVFKRCRKAQYPQVRDGSCFVGSALRDDSCLVGSSHDVALARCLSFTPASTLWTPDSPP